MKKKKLLVMAGGTGGHVFPAIAVAQTLQKQEWDICWLGTKDRMEAQLVPKYDIPIRFIQISGLRGKGIKLYLMRLLLFFVRCCRQKKLFKKKSLTLYLVWEAMFLAPLALRQNFVVYQ